MGKTLSCFNTPAGLFHQRHFDMSQWECNVSLLFYLSGFLKYWANKTKTTQIPLVVSEKVCFVFCNSSELTSDNQSWATFCGCTGLVRLSQALKVASSQFSRTCARSDTAGLTSRLYLTTNAHRNPNPKHSKYVPAYSKPAESNYS